MFIAFATVTALAVLANAAAAYVDFRRSSWVLANMTSYGVPHSWLFGLGAAKAAGALGLLVGFGLPAVGVAAGVGLTAYFILAVATVLRARHFSHLVFPGGFLVVSAAALALRLVSVG